MQIQSTYQFSSLKCIKKLFPAESRIICEQLLLCVDIFVDQDGDKKLTLSEFISLPVGTVDNQQGQDVDDSWVRERKKEFQEVIDSDRNGIVTMEELEVRSLVWLVPF